MGLTVLHFLEYTLEESELDIVICGEGDLTIRDIVNGKELKTLEESHIEITERLWSMNEQSL